MQMEQKKKKVTNFSLVSREIKTKIKLKISFLEFYIIWKKKKKKKKIWYKNK